MADIVPSLFGLTPEQYGQQQYQQDLTQGAALAKMTPTERGMAGIYASAGQLGRAFGGAMGVQDPVLQRITQQEQLLKSINFEDPQSIISGARQASASGNADLAYKLISVADQAQTKLVRRQAQIDAMQAQQTMQTAYSGGGMRAPMMDIQEQQQMADQGTPMPQNVAVAPSFDISKVEAQLMRTPGGQTILSNYYKMQEERSKGQKLIAETAKLGFEGRQQEAKALTAVEQAQADLQKAKAEADKALSESQFTERLQTLGLNEKTWNIANLKSEISTRGAKLGLDTQITNATVLEKLAQVQKLQTEIPSDSRKSINESAVAAATAQKAANQFNDLATRIEGLGGYGKLATLGEFAKSTIGAEGYETSLRQEYTRLRNSAAIKSLPPGPATDKDIQMALSGFPKDTSDSKQISQFLRGMAKLQDIDAAVANAKTDWLAQNNGVLTRATKNMMVGDFRAKPGESFNELSTRIAEDVNARYRGDGKAAQSKESQIPTPLNPNPRQEQNNIFNAADDILSRSK